MKKLLAAAALAACVMAGAPAQASTIYSQDFSSGLNANEAVGGNFGIHNGTVGHAGWYGDYEYSFYDLALDLTGVSGAQIVFDYIMNAESHYDRFNVLASLGAFLPPAGLLTPVSGLAYTDEGDVHMAQLGQVALANSASGTARFDLSGFDGQLVNLRFQFGTDGSVTSSGLNLDNITVTGNVLTSGVPEPATWAMMITGFFGAGAMVRSSRRRGVAAFA
ncbi:MAG: immune inhibitor A [Phenylobacterium sp.]|nr:PEPxxWA-CTERM sorting domain-containing protein [Phenylobacterium sp.]MDP3746058.1 immune inhibitor A [Phenylobacterium sp.]